MRALILFSIIFSFNSYAVSVDECVNTQEELGRHGVSEKDISVDCYGLFKSLANKQGISQDIENNKEAIVYRNAVYLKDLNTGEFDIDAGSSTTLIDGVAVDYNNEHLEFYVIDADDSCVKSFSSSIMGNVAPYRILKTDELIGAIDLVSYKERLYVLNQMTNKVLVYNRMANIFQREEKKFLEILDVVENVGAGAEKIELNNGQIEVKDKDDNTLKIILPKS